MAEPNSEVRTPTGEIKDQSPPIAPEKTEPTNDDSVLGNEDGDDGDDDAVLGKEDGEKDTGKDGGKKDEGEKKPDGAPEKYEALKLPEGYEAEEKEMGEFLELAKSHNLSQEGAQAFLDMHVKAVLDAAQAPVEFWQKQQKEWKAQIAADRDLGPRIKEVKANFSKMLQSINQVEGLTPEQMTANTKLIADVREALVLTGIGNNPSFIKLMDRISRNFTEGAHVSGNGPTKPSQKAPGSADRPSAAQAIYGNLPSSAG